jgi:TolB-like protein/DNA-binding winged helix-turn-helix (wHTH) protein/Tfp pilus assembly protein PilF
LLVYLARRPDEVISREELEGAVWQGTVVSYDSLTGAIRKLRGVLQDDRRRPLYIETVPKRGYRFIAPVQAMPLRADGTENTAQDANPPPPEPPKLDKSLRPGLLKFLVPTLFLLLALAGAIWAHRTFFPSSELFSVATPVPIAVLPFARLGGVVMPDHFAEGITDDIITRLATLPGLAVIARDSTFLYQPGETDVRKVARELNARYVIYGSVRLTAGQIRVNAHLVDPRTRLQLWAESYIADADVIGDLDLRITKGLMSALAPRLSRGMQQDLGQPSTSNSRAYDEFLVGRHRFYLYLNEAENQRAREHFETALEFDPQFALARAMLAWTYLFEALNGWGADREHTLRRALEQAGKAVQLSKPLPIAHFVRGVALRELGRLPEAMVEAKKALSADPSYANAHLLLATLLYRTGRFDAGLARIRTAMSLNPHHPYNYYFHLGQIQYALGQYAEAAEAFRQGLESNPASERLHVWLAASLAEIGDTSEARWEVEQVLLSNPTYSIAQIEGQLPYRRTVWVSQFLDRLRDVGLGP